MYIRGGDNVEGEVRGGVVPECDEELAERPGNVVDNLRCERELDDTATGCVEPKEKGFS